MRALMKHAIGLFSFLALVWLLLSGIYTGLILSLGLVSVALTLWISLRMDVVDEEGHPLHLTHRMPFYWLWLLKEIAIANWQVARVIWHPKLPISPTVVRVPARETTELGQVIFANSITLTPGTVSMAIENDEIEVHGLLKEMAETIAGGEMDRRVCALEMKPQDNASGEGKL